MVEKPWFIQEVNLDSQDGKLDIWIDFEAGSEFFYEDKELGVSGYFKADDTTKKTWYHLNFFQHQCYLHAWIPRVEVDNGKVRQATATWEGYTQGFTLLFGAFILELVKFMQVHQICQLYETYDSKVWTMVKTYTLLARQAEDYSDVRVNGVDEPAARRGYYYVSLFVFVDINERRKIFVRSKDRLKIC